MTTNDEPTVYIFPVWLAGAGHDADAAWLDAYEGFMMERPGPTPEGWYLADHGPSERNFTVPGPARILLGNAVVDDNGCVWVFGPQPDQHDMNKIVCIGDDTESRGYFAFTFDDAIKVLIMHGYITDLEV